MPLSSAVQEGGAGAMAPAGKARNNLNAATAAAAIHQGAIIATGSIDYPAEYRGVPEETRTSMGLSKVMMTTCTYDHRVIQGAESGMFLQAMQQLLEGEHGFYDAMLRDPAQAERLKPEMVLAIGASWLGNGLWNAAAKRLPLTLSGQMIVFETLFALLYGFAWERRGPTVLEIAATALLAASLATCAAAHRRT